ncbi:MAG: hypothetical protein KGI27_15235, partial [Thaumarchaeota archaeon]|nr:hypothetical protein [Nitrososphaerota archaeon]
GGSISNVGINLVYNNAGTSLLTNGKLTPGSTVVHIANSTSLQDFINLNSTDTTKVASPKDLNTDLFGRVTKTATIGLLFTFTTVNGNVALSANGEPIVADFFSVGLIGDGTQAN